MTDIKKECYECGYKLSCCGNCLQCPEGGMQLTDTKWFCSTGCYERYSGTEGTE